MDLFYTIVLNVFVLFGIVLMLTLFRIRTTTRCMKCITILTTYFAIMVVLVMRFSYQYSDGIYYDTRSIFISIISLFFVPFISFPVMVIAFIFRLSMGGTGLYLGLFIIVFSYISGLVGRYLFFVKQVPLSTRNVFLFGLLSHLSMLFSQFFVQESYLFVDPFHSLLLIIIIYPAATLLIVKSIIVNDDRIQQQSDLDELFREYLMLYEENPLPVVRHDKDGVIQKVNSAFCDYFQTTKEYIIGLYLHELVDFKYMNYFSDTTNGETKLFQGVYKTQNSRKEFPIRAYIKPVMINQQYDGGLVIIEDMSEIEKKNEVIHYLEKTDQLTKLYNRSVFERDISLPFPKGSSSFGMILMDVNLFHIINQTLGIETGDLILRKIGNILHNLPSEYESYRTDGDEFAIVYSNKTEQEIKELIAIIIDKIEQETASMSFDVNVSVVYQMADSSDVNLQNTYKSVLRNLKNKELKRTTKLSKKSIDLIMATLFEKSQREMEHSRRVGELSAFIAKKMGLKRNRISTVALAGTLHDIGKIKIDLNILDKPGSLTDLEYETMKKHTLSGYRILRSVEEYKEISNIILSHHEHVDGSGYPHGLSMNDIPLESRIISVADAYDAMTNDRPYRSILTSTEAINVLRQCSGTQFDPDVVETLQKCFDEFATIKK